MPPGKKYQRKCEVCGVKKNPKTSKSVFLARFPKDTERCRAWVKAAGNEDLAYLPINKLHELKFICGDHFSRKCFTKNKSRLRKTAVPTIDLRNPPIPENILSEFPLPEFKNPGEDNAAALPVLYTIVIKQETEQDSLVDEATDTKQNEEVQKQDETDQKQNDSDQKQNDSDHKHNDSDQKHNDSVQKQNDSVQKQNDAVQKRIETAQKRVDTSQKWFVTVQKRIETAQKPVETDQKRYDSTRKRNYTVRKEDSAVPEKKLKVNNILQKAMNHAELPVVSEKQLEDTMDMDDYHDDDGDRPWRVDDDDDKDVALSFVQDPDLEMVEHEVVIETQPQEQTSRSEVCDGTHVPQSGETTEPQAVQYGQCRCCLEMGTHTVLDVIHELECFNMPVATDPRLSRLVCSACGKFLQEARRFRDMAAASQNLLLDNLTDGDVKYPSVCSNASGVAAAHDDEFERELTDIRQQSGLQVLEMTDDVGMQDEMSDDEDTKADLEIPDEGGTQERPLFSQLSDYPDAQIATEVNYENLSAKDFKEMVQENKRKWAKFTTRIRQNLIMLLDYSTVLPFLSITGETFECIYCDGTFLDIDQLRAHVEESHRNEETDFKHDILKLRPEMILFVDVSFIYCKLCDEQFTTIDNLVQHLVETHKKKYHNLCLDPPHNIIPFNLSLDIPQCVECDKTFPSFRKLRLHVIKHYGQYLCHQCGSKFLYENHYRQHIRIHHDDTKYNLTCDVCGDNFRNKKLLLFHYYKNHYDIMKSQTEQPDIKESTDDVEEENVAYECMLCNNGTTYTLTAAYMHRIGHLNNTREGPYSCEVCGHMSPVKKEFRAHLQGHYGIKKYVCEVCKKMFNKNSQLSDHMSVHLNLRFHCPLCDTTLYDKKLLIRHVKIQHPDVNVAFSL